MLKFKSWIVWFLLVFNTLGLKAQNHYAAWFRGTVSVSLNKQFKVDQEFQYRSQNGFTNKNLFDKDLLSSYRSWIHFQTSPTVKFSVSPFAYFYHTNLKENKYSNEYRYSIACETQKLFLVKQSILNRFAFEYRMFENASNNVIRFRDRISYRYEVSDKINVTFSDECFLNMSNTSTGFFDQNRIGINFGYMFSRHLKLDVGYNFVNRKLASNLSQEFDNNLLIYLSYLVGKGH
jgi:hypothetical protein